jgi:hypothetical protein
MTVRELRVILLACVALLLLAAAPTASAHLRSGTVAVDYRASILAPDTSAYTAQIYQSDRALNMSIKPGHTVTVLGYLGEPMFRLDRSGLWVNDASPTSVVAGLMTKRQRVVATSPRWRLQRGRRSVTWRDARVQALPSGVNAGTWGVPMLLDGHRARLNGTLRRLPKPALWPWLATLGASLAVVVLFLLTRPLEDARRVAVSLALITAGASVVIAFAFSLDAYASPGTWIASFDELFFIAIGIWALLRGPERWRGLAAIGVGLLGMAVGISKGAIFFHPIVLAVLPGTVTRLAVIVAAGGGLAASILGGVSYSEAPWASAAQVQRSRAA